MFEKLILTATVAVAAIAFAAPSQAATNLVTNGSFEQTGLSGNFEFDANYAAGAGKLTGWSSTGGYNILYHSSNANTAAGNAAGQYAGTGREYLNASAASPDGGNFVALDGDSAFASRMYQTVGGLTVGKVYTLSFYYAAAQIASRSGGPVTESITASFGTDSYTTPTLTLASPATSYSGWNFVSTSFTAKSTSQLLSFLSNGTPAGQPPVALLDGVKLAAAVPEPASWAMMIGGFGMIGAALRRSRRAQLAFA